MDNTTKNLVLITGIAVLFYYITKKEKPVEVEM